MHNKKNNVTRKAIEWILPISFIYKKKLIWQDYPCMLANELGILWLWHFLYSVGPRPVSSLHICTFVVSRAFMAGAASQTGDAYSCRAPGLTSGLQGSVYVLRGALLFVPQWQCISSFVYLHLKGHRHDWWSLFTFSFYPKFYTSAEWSHF